MKLNMLGVPMTKIAQPFLGAANSSYRVTMTSNADGSRIERRTWWRVPNEPQPLAKHEKDWYYDMKVRRRRSKRGRGMRAPWHLDLYPARVTAARCRAWSDAAWSSVCATSTAMSTRAW